MALGPFLAALALIGWLPVQAGERVGRVRVVNALAEEVRGGLSGLADLGISFMSVDPTDNSLLIRAPGEKWGEIFLEVQGLDHRFDPLCSLSARRPFIDAATFLAFEGPGQDDAGSDAVTVRAGGDLSVHFASIEGRSYAVAFVGSATEEVRAQLERTGWPSRQLDLRPGPTHDVLIRVPGAGNRGVSQVIKVTVISGELKVRSVSLERDR